MNNQSAAISNKTVLGQELLSLLQAMPMAALITGQKGELMAQNRLAVRLLGQLPAGSICQALTKILGLSHEFVCLENPVLRQANPEDMSPIRHKGEVTKNSRKIPVTVDKTLIFEEDSPRIYYHLLTVHEPNNIFTLPHASIVAPAAEKVSQYFQSSASPVWLAELEKYRQENEHLHNELARCQQAMEISETGLWELEVGSGKLSLSPVCLTQLGYETSYKIDSREAWESLVFPEDLSRLQRIWRSVAEGHSERYSSEYRVRNAEGNYVWIADKGRLVRHGHRSTVTLQGTHENIHAKVMHALVLTADNRQLQGENMLLNSTNNALSSSNQALTQFVHIASHDLQSPLRKIRQFIGLFTNKYRPVVDEQGQRYIDSIMRTSNRMSSLIEDLMHYSSVHVNQDSPGIVNLQDVIKEVCSDLMDGQDGVEMHLPTQPLPLISGHYTQLVQLFQNLVGNGIKYNTQLTKHIVIEHRLVNDWLLIRVGDNGIGVPEELQHRIFDLFFRGHAKTDYEGTGIGLAICKGIVDKMGGQLTVESTVGEGSSFYIKLPRDIVQAQ